MLQGYGQKACQGTRPQAWCVHTRLGRTYVVTGCLVNGHAVLDRMSEALRTRPGCEGMTTMQLSIIKEITNHEHRVAFTPAGAKA